MLNAEGLVTEATGANIFIVRNNKIITNDENSAILPGITRDSVIKLAQHLGYLVNIRSIEPDELLKADEVFLTGTAMQIAPVGEIDGKKIGDGFCGSATYQIQECFFDVVSGKVDKFRHWLNLF